ncbi:MAG: hypothetical protein AMJ90_08910 [candidate division Zixibacteria bacterium SM23_73_2]|nr:MAG: hypothetical protein AMJ90_08910 [candidate division Zixibacteria bacterium SM23_73_2]
MDYQEKIEKVLKQIQKSADDLEVLISGTNDYDLQRILKKVDAQLMDAQHNLVLAKKISGKRKRH